MSPLLPFAPFLLYLVALISLLRGATEYIIAGVWTAGCLLHAVVLFGLPGTSSGFAFTFFNALALTSLLLNVLVLVWALFQPTRHLGLITLPFALVREPNHVAGAEPGGAVWLSLLQRW